MARASAWKQFELSLSFILLSKHHFKQDYYWQQENWQHTYCAWLTIQSLYVWAALKGCNLVLSVCLFRRKGWYTLTSPMHWNRYFLSSAHRNRLTSHSAFSAHLNRSDYLSIFNTPEQINCPSSRSLNRLTVHPQEAWTDLLSIFKRPEQIYCPFSTLLNRLTVHPQEARTDSLSHFQPARTDQLFNLNTPEEINSHFQHTWTGWLSTLNAHEHSNFSPSMCSTD